MVLNYNYEFLKYSNIKKYSFFIQIQLNQPIRS